MSTPDWSRVETPTDSTLYDVEVRGEDAYAVGSDGIVLARVGDGEWETIVENGPTENGNSLYGLDVTEDRERVWFVGSSGVVGEYDTVEGEISVHEMNGVENAFNDVAVTGESGDATVTVVDGSGYVHRNEANGDEGSWKHVRPGTGAEIKAVDFPEPRTGTLADTDGAVYETGDGESWETAIDGVGVTLYGTDGAADGDQHTWVTGDGTVCHRHGAEWQVDAPTSSSLHDVDCTDSEAMTVGGGGLVFRYDDEWVQEETPTEETLNAVGFGDLAVAVGASGVIVER